MKNENSKMENVKCTMPAIQIAFFILHFSFSIAFKMPPRRTESLFCDFHSWPRLPPLATSV